ncbi:MAG: hypothetical protein ACREAU_05545, partial [Nitrosopumilaceae archaeon]
APSQVGGNFFCSNTKISSLEGAPSQVGGDFSCHNTNITSLEGAPSQVGGWFNCADTDITSLEGAPSQVGSNFISYKTNITSLHNIHKQIKHIGNKFYLSKTTNSNVIGVMFIRGLKSIEFHQRSEEQKQVENIINRHLKRDRNIHDCQEELIEAGLSEYAKI